MRTFGVYLLSGATVLTLLTACGPSQQEQQQREQARQDSLEQVRQQAEQQRLDSLAKAKKQAEADSIAAQKKKEQEERNAIKFDPNGPLAVQVEAWRSRDKAQDQVSKWQDRGFPDAYVVKHGNADTGNIWFRVRLGRVASEAMAERLGKRLQQEYSEEFWIADVTGEGTTPDSAD